MSARDESADLLLPGRGMAAAYWTQVPEWVTLADVSDRAVRLYAVLAAHVNHRRELPDGSPDRRSFPGQARIGSMMRTSHSSVKRALAELVALDAVTVTVARWGQNRMKRRNLYTVHLDPPRGYTGPTSITQWGREKPQVEPMGSPVTRPVGSPVTHKPDEGTTTPTKSKNTPPARPPAAREGDRGEQADRSSQVELRQWIEQRMDEDGIGYVEAARSALFDLATNDGYDCPGMEEIIDRGLDRGDHPARILNTIYKQAENYT